MWWSAVIPACLSLSSNDGLRCMLGKTCHGMSTACLPASLRSGTPTKFHSTSVRTSTSCAFGSVFRASQVWAGATFSTISFSADIEETMTALYHGTAWQDDLGEA